MKKNAYLFMVCLFLLIAGIATTACSSDDEPKAYDESNLNMLIETRVSGASQNAQPNGELPEWIQEWVQEKTAFIIKYKEYYKDFPDTGFKIYQCKWKDHLFYFIPNDLNSCYYCSSVYDSDGTMVEWDGIEEVADFCSNSTSWLCIVDLKYSEES